MNSRDLIENILAQHPEHTRELYNGFAALRYASILTDENIHALAQQPKYALRLSLAFKALHKAGILKDKNRQILIQYAKHAINLGKALNLLHLNNILTNENHNALSLHGEYADHLFDGLRTLHQAGILTNENWTTLILHAEHARELSEGFKILYETKKDLLINENINTLAQQAEHAIELSRGFALSFHLRILTNENRNTLIQQAKYTIPLAIGFCRLHEAKLLTASNIKRLVANPMNSYTIAERIIHSTNSDRLAAMKFPYNLVPDKYCCTISMDIMDKPGKLLKTPHYFDFESIKQILIDKNSSEHPVTREAIDRESFKPDEALKIEIDAWVNKVVSLIEACNKENLSADEFKSIAEQATKEIAKPVAPASSSSVTHVGLYSQSRSSVNPERLTNAQDNDAELEERSRSNSPSKR